jgi:PhoH-like ATPase
MPLPKAPTKPAALLLSIPTTAAKPPKDVLLPAQARSTPDTAADRQSPSARLALVDTANDKAPAARTDAKPRSNGRKQRANGPSKLFVLDTNVLMHDSTSLFRFEEHDVFLPMMTLEELDGHKKGMSEVARSARQVSRTLDALVASCKSPIEEGIALNALGNTEAAGRLYFQTQAVVSQLPASLPPARPTTRSSASWPV